MTDHDPDFLGSLIRAELDRDGSRHPQVIAGVVIAGLVDDQLRGALLSTVPLLVKRLKAERQNGRVGSGPQTASSPPEAPAQADLATMLADTVCVRHRVWKPLGDCSVAELRAMASYRYQLVTQQTGTARRYDHLADALQQAGDRALRDLPPPVLESLLSHI